MVKHSRAAIPQDVDELLKKHAVTQQADFLERRTVPGPLEANKEKKQRKLEKQTTLSQWGGMKKGNGTREEKQALKLLHWNHYMGDASFRRPTKEPMPEFYEFGVEVGSKTDLNAPYNKPKRKVNYANALVKSIVKSEAAQALLKEHQADKQAKVVRKEKSKLRKNLAKRNAKKRKRSGGGL
ncbi:hypothetical protein DIPPA_22259 [Diplonema papillatum]|nr:hypothetical protein DIPPA_22259 [Diplonema papillatum]